MTKVTSSSGVRSALEQLALTHDLLSEERLLYMLCCIRDFGPMLLDNLEKEMEATACVEGGYDYFDLVISAVVEDFVEAGLANLDEGFVKTSFRGRLYLCSYGLEEDYYEEPSVAAAVLGFVGRDRKDRR